MVYIDVAVLFSSLFANGLEIMVRISRIRVYHFRNGVQSQL